MIGVGAAFCFHSGVVKWAPAWIRNLGLEWLYRFVQHPKRMWRRNADGIIFLAKVVGQFQAVRRGQQMGLYGFVQVGK